MAHKAPSSGSNIQGQFAENTPNDDAELLGEDQQDLSPLTQAKQPRKTTRKGANNEENPLVCWVALHPMQQLWSTAGTLKN